MSSRFADSTTMRTRSPIYHDEGTKRSPPSPSTKAPPPKKIDVKSRAVSEEPCPPSKALQAVVPLSSESHTQPCMDKLPSNRVIVDREVFQQILELDEQGSNEFSQSVVREYLDQAQSTIKSMDENFAKRELAQLGRLGHFLKGSSAALGAVQVQKICEEIQHLGYRANPERMDVKSPAEEDTLAKIKPLLASLKDEYTAAAKSLEILLEGPKPESFRNPRI